MLADMLRAFDHMALVDEDGQKQTIELLPPITPDELRTLEQRLPGPIPGDIRQALLVSKGLANGPLESFSLVDLEGFGLEEVFPNAHSIAHDGYGNYWVIDLLPTSTSWSPVYFACHDPAVIVYQAATVEEFLDSAMDLWRPGRRSAVGLVHEEAAMRIWDQNPLAHPRAAVLAGDDAGLRSFAESVPPSALIADLRAATTGDGFSWGAFGPRTELRRWGTEGVWAITPPEKKAGWLGRLFGRR